jgi:hypothetical protein
MCVLMPLHYYICVRILLGKGLPIVLYVCPHLALYYHMCPHTTRPVYHISSKLVSETDVCGKLILAVNWSRKRSIR